MNCKCALPQGAAARTADAAAVALRNKVQRDGGKSAARSIAWTIGGGVGLSLAVRTLTGGSPLEHPLVEVRPADSARVRVCKIKRLVIRQSSNQQAAVSATCPDMSGILWCFEVSLCQHALGLRRHLPRQ